MLFRHGVLGLVSGYRAWGMGRGGIDYPSTDWLHIIIVLVCTTTKYSPIHMVEIRTACTHRGQSKKACSPMVSSLDNPEPSHGTAKLLRLTASCLQKYHILSTPYILLRTYSVTLVSRDMMPKHEPLNPNGGGSLDLGPALLYRN